MSLLLAESILYYMNLKTFFGFPKFSNSEREIVRKVKISLEESTKNHNQTRAKMSSATIFYFLFGFFDDDINLAVEKIIDGSNGGKRSKVDEKSKKNAADALRSAMKIISETFPLEDKGKPKLEKADTLTVLKLRDFTRSGPMTMANNSSHALMTSLWDPCKFVKIYEHQDNSNLQLMLQKYVEFLAKVTNEDVNMNELINNEKMKDIINQLANTLHCTNNNKNVEENDEEDNENQSEKEQESEDNANNARNFDNSLFNYRSGSGYRTIFKEGNKYRSIPRSRVDEIEETLESWNLNILSMNWEQYHEIKDSAICHREDKTRVYVVILDKKDGYIAKLFRAELSDESYEAIKELPKIQEALRKIDGQYYSVQPMGKEK